MQQDAGERRQCRAKPHVRRTDLRESEGRMKDAEHAERWQEGRVGGHEGHALLQLARGEAARAGSCCDIAYYEY